jgi:hypothetical protein
LTPATTIKKALASVSPRDNHRPAATANHHPDCRAPPIQIVAQYIAVRLVHADVGGMLVSTSRFFAPMPTYARLLIPHALPHDCLHASQRVLNLGTIRDFISRELVSAETAGQISPELQLP